MTRRRAIEMLQEYQRWRRGEPLLHWKEGKKTPNFPYSSQMLGQAKEIKNAPGFPGANCGQRKSTTTLLFQFTPVAGRQREVYQKGRIKINPPA